MLVYVTDDPPPAPAPTGSRTLGNNCYFDDQGEVQTRHAPSDPRYSANAMFFGAEAEYLAVMFLILPSDPSGIRIPVSPENPNNAYVAWGTFRGLVILKRTMAL